MRTSAFEEDTSLPRSAKIDPFNNLIDIAASPKKTAPETVLL
jgi:hypothetical protein